MSSIYYYKRRKRWCLEIKIEGRKLFTSCKDRQPLERMCTIIKNNQMPYSMVKNLMTDFRAKNITHYVGHKYLYPGLGYRIILGYSNFDGFICSFYNMPTEAYNDWRIQSRIAKLGFIQGYDCVNCLNSLETKGIWSISCLTILYCKISKKGNIIPLIPNITEGIGDS